MMINKVNHWKKLRKPQLEISRFKNDYVVWVILYDLKKCRGNYQVNISTQNRGFWLISRILAENRLHVQNALFCGTKFQLPTSQINLWLTYGKNWPSLTITATFNLISGTFWKSCQFWSCALKERFFKNLFEDCNSGWPQYWAHF